MLKRKRLLILFLLVTTILLIPWAMSAFMFDATTVTVYGSTNQSTQNNSSQESFGNISLKEHKITAPELAKLKSEVGVYQQGKNYNLIVNGHGTGLQPPTAIEWNAISENAYVVDNVSYANAPSAVDNSNSPYFPPIGNQANQGSCVTWSIGYYTKTYQEAKEHSWNLSGATWDGGYSGYPKQSYQDKIISPAFIYNLINGGQDEGSSYYNAIQLVCFIGVSSWAKMSYNRLDYTSWPSEAAWAEAPYYRGNSSGYQYIRINDNTGISNLKNWLASGNLATASVDSYKIQDHSTGASLLTDKDMLTLDNYVNPSTNHAATVVGYDDNISYTEQNQTRYGAFKIANSWGKGGWEHISDGFYWISYEAMKQRVATCYYYFDQINYQPDLLATFNINDSVRSNCLITVGLGNPSKPITTKCFSNYVFGGAQPFCTNNIVLDVTEFKDYVPSLYNQSFFLEVYDNQGYQTNGTIKYFAIGNWSALGTPCPTVKYQNVFLNVIYNPYVASSITLLPAGESTPLSAANEFAVSFTLGNQPQVSYAQNGTLKFSSDSGTNVVISGVSTGSIFTGSQEYGNLSIEEWVLNSLGANVTVTAGSNTTFYYYDLLSQQVAYAIAGGGNPLSPLFTYNTAPSTASAKFNQTINVISLPGWFQQTLMVLKGTSAFASNPILGVAQDKWATPITYWNVSQTNQIPNLIIYYHQYQVTAVYSTSDSSVLSSALLLSGTQFGSNYQLPLTTTNQTTWLDANTPWSTSNIVIAASGTEQWVTSVGTSGNITGAITINPNYVHQYYLALISTYGNPSGQGWYDAGNAINFNASSPVSGGSGIQYVFVGWNGSGSGSYNGTSISQTVTMNNPITETASWTTQCYLTVSSSYGTPSGSGWYNAGSTAYASVNSGTVSGVSSTQYVFTSWSTGGSNYAQSSGITMNAPMTATTSWITQYQIVPSADSNTVINPSSAVWVNTGSSQTFTYSANSGYTVNFVLVDGSSVPITGSYTFNNVQANHAISVTGAVNPTITASAGDSGSINPSGYVSLNYGVNQTFNITANTGYYIVDVSVNGSSVGAVSSFTFTNIQATYTISATFAPTPTPSPSPSPSPSPTSTPSPTPTPTASPTSQPTFNPTSTPTQIPTSNPTQTPTSPTTPPTITPTPTPSSSQLQSPSPSPLSLTTETPLYLYAAAVLAISAISATTLILIRKKR